MVAGDGLAPPRSPSKGDVLLLDDPATKWWAREDLHLQGSQILDLWGLLFPLNHSPEIGAPGRNLTGNHSLRRAAL